MVFAARESCAVTCDWGAEIPIMPVLSGVNAARVFAPPSSATIRSEGGR